MSGCDYCESEEMTALLRRDWAVRVLDARVLDSWADGNGWYRHSTTQVSRGFDDVKCGDWMCLLENYRDSSKDFRRYGKSPDFARVEMAKFVFPTLSAKARAELGECP